MEPLDMGAKVKDAVTGFVGFVTARVVYMTGCVQYEITPATLKDGVPQKALWIDEQRLKPVRKTAPKRSPRDRSPYGQGGPHNPPTRNSPPGAGDD